MSRSATKGVCCRGLGVTEPADDKASGLDNPLEAVFETAVRPFESGAALRAQLPADAPIILMRKGDELPSETRELPEGGTLKVPVLDALKNSKLAEWHRVGQFDFAAMGRDEIGLLFLEGGAGGAALKVVTRGRGDTLLVADLGAMLDAFKALAGTAAFKAFPGAEFLLDALTRGIESAQRDLLEALRKPDASGKSLIENFREMAGEPR